MHNFKYKKIQDYTKLDFNEEEKSKKKYENDKELQIEVIAWTNY